MNIFAVNDDPSLAAKDLSDKLVLKMTLESTQIVATAFSEKFLNLGFLLKKDGSPYRPTHVNHPCVKWAANNIDNLKWLTEHGLALAKEYTRRYGKIHACESQLKNADSTLATLGADSLRHERFTMAMPEEFRSSDPVKSYRHYLHSKAYSAWDKDPKSLPKWWDEKLFSEIKK